MTDYRLIARTPTIPEYRSLRRGSGLSDKTEEAATRGLPATQFAVVIEFEGAAVGMGVFAIRVLAGGALAGHAPSAHTLKTPFFPLDLYQRDAQRAVEISGRLPRSLGIKEAAVRVAISHPSISAAIVGFGETSHIDEAVAWADRGPLDADVLATVGGSVA